MQFLEEILTLLLDDDDDRGRKFFSTVAMEFHRMETEQSSHQSKHGGSSIGRQHIPRNRVGDNEQLMRDYFAEDPLFPPHKFRRRSRMNRDLFLCILNTTTTLFKK
ncbi:hypothetical protein Vadar_011343 [Vaccinium darrowii]|uniref:Uncharacterized protein n=1 Tax=Vaccinium darrowii TaxID=229202 RepID=A0ACB7XPW2_9ERIC|nr:hypothetical protein Vadar_011343 [Vaccinium darrowii]